MFTAFIVLLCACVAACRCEYVPLGRQLLSVPAAQCAAEYDAAFDALWKTVCPSVVSKSALWNPEGNAALCATPWSHLRHNDTWVRLALSPKQESELLTAILSGWQEANASDVVTSWVPATFARSFASLAGGAHPPSIDTFWFAARELQLSWIKMYRGTKDAPPAWTCGDIGGDRDAYTAKRVCLNMADSKLNTMWPLLNVGLLFASPGWAKASSAIRSEETMRRIMFRTTTAGLSTDVAWRSPDNPRENRFNAYAAALGALNVEVARHVGVDASAGQMRLFATGELVSPASVHPDGPIPAWSVVSYALLDHWLASGAARPMFLYDFSAGGGSGSIIHTSSGADSGADHKSTAVHWFAAAEYIAFHKNFNGGGNLQANITRTSWRHDFSCSSSALLGEGEMCMLQYFAESMLPALWLRAATLAEVEPTVNPIDIYFDVASDISFARAAALQAPASFLLASFVPLRSFTALPSEPAPYDKTLESFKKCHGEKVPSSGFLGLGPGGTVESFSSTAKVPIALYALLGILYALLIVIGMVPALVITIVCCLRRSRKASTRGHPD